MICKSSSRGGFTLVEILVVVGILAILSALLFSVFSRAREKGRTATCQSNLRQVGIAFQQYVADEGRYPLWYNTHMPENPLPSAYPGLPWAVRIQSYVKDLHIYHCPSHGTPITSDPMDNSSYRHFISYSYNLGLGNLTDSQIGHPTEVISLYDQGGAGYSPWLNTASTAYPSGGGDRHSGGANYLFLDGHVKWLELQQATFSPYLEVH